MILSSDIRNFDTCYIIIVPQGNMKSWIIDEIFMVYDPMTFTVAELKQFCKQERLRIALQV